MTTFLVGLEEVLHAHWLHRVCGGRGDFKKTKRRLHSRRKNRRSRKKKRRSRKKKRRRRRGRKEERKEGRTDPTTGGSRQ